MKRLVLIIGLLLASTKSWALSWQEFIYNSEGEVVKFTALKSVAPSYFYNAFSGRSEVGATTPVFWVGSFVSADVGYSVPNAEDTNVGTVILGGNLHVDKLAISAFPNQVAFLKEYTPNAMEKFFSALQIGAYIGHDTTNRELAGGIYSGLELRF